MGHTYGVLGAGRQGLAAAFDLARFGGADRVELADVSEAAARDGAARVNTLLGSDRVGWSRVGAGDPRALREWLEGIDSFLSAVPYPFNPAVARAAIDAKACMADLGGNTAVVFEQLDMDPLVRLAGVRIVPDCGLAPGLAQMLAVHGMRQLDLCKSVHVRCGGLPRHPEPPLGYALLFHIGGLVNEYSGKAVYLRGGKIVEVDTLTELEELEFPAPVGKAEAFVTSGGTSTCPYTFEGKLDVYDYKTVRYPGHCRPVSVMRDLGLFNTEPIEIDGVKIAPRRVFEAVASRALTRAEVDDVVVLRVTCRGTKDGKNADYTMDLMDFKDPVTGFTAMERTTGFPAAMVVAALPDLPLPPGAHRLEQVPFGPGLLDDLRKRGLKLEDHLLSY